MQPLEPPDSFAVAAAEGWLELGNPAEAGAELTRLASATQTHPHVLEVRWAICAQGRDWAAALEIARALMQAVPDESVGWLHYAYALRRTAGGGLLAAWDALLPALKKFPKEPIVPYNLACYACQLGRLEEARPLLQFAFQAGEKERVKRMALADPDLEPLWREIAQT